MQETEREKDLQETQKERWTCRRHRKREGPAKDTEREGLHSCRRQKKRTRRRHRKREELQNNINGRKAKEDTQDLHYRDKDLQEAGEENQLYN